MIKRIITALSRALDEVYPDIPKVDLEIEQDTERPAFFISCISSDLTERITRAGFFKTFSFDILFDPGDNEPDLFCEQIEDELTLLLRRVEDPYSHYAFRPEGLHFVMSDGILHALFNVRESLYLPNEEEKIQRFSINTLAEKK